MRSPVDSIAAPPFPARLPWVNVASLRMDQQIGRPVLVEFFDFCRVNSLRTLPYMKAWHERYTDDGLRVIGVHCPGFEPSAEEDAVREAVGRLGIEHPVLIDSQFEVWQMYGNEGWPARYLFGADGILTHYHYGEGAYDETEGVVQELLGVGGALLAPIRREDEPGAALVAPTPDQEGAWSGPYEAGGVWAVLSGQGTLRANGSDVSVEHPGCYPLLEHPRHTAGVLSLDVPAGVICHAVCFTPGLAH